MSRPNVELIFHAAREMSEEKRAGYLEGVCANDISLRAKIDALLEADVSAGSFLSEAGARPREAEDVTIDPPPREMPGERIGRYKLLQRIGDGGFGSVWMAEQREPVKRRVALKIIKLGMDTKQVIARFEAERQALAMMDHPNIAKVLDAGATEAGRPYFVMELVKGVPITEYCDTEHLGTKERVDLFRAVCHAVQHAHQKGIIHRDIKPSNVLVTLHDGKPVPKVIDFGIAKATNRELTDKTMFTEFRQFIGTPEYMSPEQAEMSGLDIDTRSDVYSLGVLLYELLTGSTPFDGRRLRSAGLHEIQRIIREEEPQKPSTRLSTLGEQVTEVAKHRRVDAVHLTKSLKGDLDWIVLKCLEKDRGRRYETANGLAADLRRHLANQPVMAGPPSARYRARKFILRHRLAVSAVSALVVVLSAGIAGTAGALLFALDARAAELEAEALVAEVLASQLSGIEVRTMANHLSKDLIAEARAANERLGVNEQDLAVSPERMEQLLAGMNLTNVAQKTLTRTIFEPALKAVDERFTDPDDMIRAQLLQTIADALMSIGLVEAAEDPQTKALEARRRVLGESDPDTLTSVSGMGVLRHVRGMPEEAELLLREALAGRRRVLGPDHPDTLTAISNVGAAITRRIPVEAERYQLEALTGRRRVLGDTHPDTLNSFNLMGAVLTHQDRFAEAEPFYSKALKGRRRVLGPDHPDTLTSIASMGILLRAQGKLDEAESHYVDALERRRRVLGDAHRYTLDAVNNMGVLRQAQGRWADAETHFRDALRGYRRALGDGHSGTLQAANSLGAVLNAQERYAESEQLLSERLPPKGSAFTEARIVLGEALVGIEQYSEAEELLDDAHASLDETPPTGRSLERLAPTIDRLVRLYDARGKHEQADEWSSRLAQMQGLVD